MPASVTERGLPLALSVKVSAADLAPTALGVKVRFSVRVPPPRVTVFGNDGGETSAKSPAFAPPKTALEITRSASPELVMVRDLAALVVPTFWLLKVMLLALRLTDGAIPAPESATELGLFAALWEIVRVADRKPVPAGVKVT